MERNTKRTVDLVDLIVRLALEEAEPEVKTLVTHKWPDDDAWLCLWLAKKFVPKMAEASLAFVNAGETLPSSENDPTVVHFDTGRGKHDQHGKRMERTCSAALVAKELGIIDNPGLESLLEMATAVDNIEQRGFTDLHFLILGYPREFKNDNGPDWEKVQERIFENFDIVYGQASQRSLNRANLEILAERTVLKNGLKVTSVLWHPELRDAAFEEGAAVVIWTTRKGKDMFYTGIQVNRDYPIFLGKVAADLNLVEGNARKAVVQKGDVWYLHDSQKLILNGSRTHDLTKEEFTQLLPRQIIGMVHRALEVLPREKVSQWNSK